MFCVSDQTPNLTYKGTDVSNTVWVDVLCTRHECAQQRQQYLEARVASHEAMLREAARLVQQQAAGRA